MRAMKTAHCLFGCALLCMLLCSGQGEGVCEDTDPDINCRLWSATLHYCPTLTIAREKCPLSCHACGPCHTYPCAEDEVCVSSSTLLNGTYECVCADGYTGGPCSDSLCVGVTACRNGGTCMVDPLSDTGYTCVCITGFIGSHCQECSDDLVPMCRRWASSNLCHSVYASSYCRVSCSENCPTCIREPCQNGGTCLDSGACDCTGTGFAEEACEVHELCVSSPCQNGGNCTINGTCDCSGTGFMGEYCEAQTCPQYTEVSTYNYQQVPVLDVGHRSSLVFGVRACTNAHLALSTSLDLSANMTEVVIGAGVDTYAEIRACRLNCVRSSLYRSLLSCDAFATFWVSWEEMQEGAPPPSTTTTYVSLGVGERVGVDLQLRADLGQVVQVRHVSVASVGGTLGVWNFDFNGQTVPTPCPTTTPLTSPDPTTETSPADDDITTSSSSSSSTFDESSSSSSSPASSPQTFQTPITSTSTNTTTQAGVTRQKCTCRKADSSTDPSEVQTALDKAEEWAQQLKKNLTLTNQTSAQRRAKISASDSRPSARAIGSVAVVILILVGLLVIVPDISSTCVRLRGKAMRGRGAWNTEKEEEEVSRVDSGGGRGLLGEDYSGREVAAGGSENSLVPKKV